MQWSMIESAASRICKFCAGGLHSVPEIYASMCETCWSEEMIMAATQPVMYGRVRYVTSKHPLYKTWRNLTLYDPDSEWSSFSHFADTVGLRPPRTKMKKIDESKPFGPNNWQWRPLRPVVNG